MATMIKPMPAEPLSGPAAGPSTGIARHIEDFREFFSARGVSFGSAADLPPFVARLAADASFRNDMASMVRTVIYRERDGVSRLELVEMVATAVEGTDAENAGPELRDAERRVVAFIDGVFRTRWNPGEGAGVVKELHVMEKREAEAVDGEANSADAAEDPARPPEAEQTAHGTGHAAPHGTGHATTSLFYRAQVVAGVEPAEAIAEERRAASATPDPVPEPRVDAAEESSFRPVETALPGLAAEEYELLPLQKYAAETTGSTGKTSRFWMWAAGVCALVLAFCAGLVVHQRLLVPLRDPNQPYERPPADTAPEVTAEQAARSGSNASVSDIRAARAARRGEGELVGPAFRGSRSRVAEARRPADEGAWPGAESATEDGDLQPRYMAPAMIGASPALMASHLVYAPRPGYPVLAEVSHIEGRVLVEAVVSKSGRVIRAQAISGHRLLRRAAVREVYARRYRPYLLNDRPTDVATIVTVDFRLNR